MDNASRKRSLPHEEQHEEDGPRRLKPCLAMDSTVANNPLVIQRMDSPPPSPPESSCSSSQSEDEDGDQSDDDGLLAGFEFCSKEAIRYLLEEEKLSPDHPVVRNLQLHLLRAATGGSTVADDPPQEN